VTLRAVVEDIRRRGPVPFDAYLDAALYGPGEGGFFSGGRGAGRSGADFITSPEVGHLFGACVARVLDTEWARLGRPDPFVVVEVGAGRGALARAVLDAAPSCLPALRYVMVERSPVLADAAADLVPVEPAANVLGTVSGPDGEERVVAAGGGPVVAVLEDLPVARVSGVVLANELLDNVPFRLFERRAEGWDEVRVGLADDGGEQLVEVLVATEDDRAAELSRLAPDAAPGARVPLQAKAADWLRSALGVLEEGRLVLVDYADTTAGMAARPWQEWVRTYRDHERGGHPLEAPGEQDVTCEVAVDQLARVRHPDADTSQAEWLRAHGIDELVEAARATWHERAHVGDLDALKARSRVGEAEALLDPTGLGAFRVLEWQVERR
jgi:SAM-dependent MidA family methyltransferase